MYPVRYITIYACSISIGYNFVPSCDLRWSSCILPTVWTILELSPFWLIIRKSTIFVITIKIVLVAMIYVCGCRKIYEIVNLFTFRDKLSVFMESKGAAIPGMLVLTQNLSKVRVVSYKMLALKRIIFCGDGSFIVGEFWFMNIFLLLFCSQWEDLRNTLPY